MASFAQCPRCLAEYRDPADRRYHSETNSCPTCGPRIWLEEGEGRVEGTEEVLAAAMRILAEGKILAVRGLGGFHLAVDATSEKAVARLRERKAREARPLAVMVLGLPQARELGEVGPAQELLLASAGSPVVLLQAPPGSPLAPSVAPGLDTVGVMTAYTPLHLLLLEGVGRPLVMTSGNRSEEPIATGNQEARDRLGGIADAFLLHDREIVSRYDDSVVRPSSRGTLFIRRSRGYAPLPLPLPLETPVPLVAVGPHLKNTFALAQGAEVFLSQHVGDLENLETLEHFQEARSRLQALFRVEPEVAVRDLHPGYLSTRLAGELGLERIIPVQHHHAHVAAVLAEHGETGPAVGVAFDGTGYGDDGKVWGGEILVADLRGYRRAAHLRYAPLPGGDKAVVEPWRSALGYFSLGEPGALPVGRAFQGVGEEEMEVASTQIRRRLNAPEASSVGRLFDAAAAVLGVRQRCRHEAQAAMELEALAGRIEGDRLPFPYVREADPGPGRPDGVAGREARPWVLDPLPLLEALAHGVESGRTVPELAAAFHASVAWAAAALALQVAHEENLQTVALSGGVFQNLRLLEETARILEAGGVRVLVPKALSPNDGAVSYGQAAVAAATLHSEGQPGNGG